MRLVLFLSRGLGLTVTERIDSFYDMDVLVSELLSELIRLLTQINYPLVQSQAVTAAHPVSWVRRTELNLTIWTTSRYPY
jgi:hypothetical protein